MTEKLLTGIYNRTANKVIEIHIVISVFYLIHFLNVIVLLLLMIVSQHDSKLVEPY